MRANCDLASFLQKKQSSEKAFFLDDSNEYTVNFYMFRAEFLVKINDF